MVCPLLVSPLVAIVFLIVSLFVGTATKDEPISFPFGVFIL